MFETDGRDWKILIFLMLVSLILVAGCIGDQSREITPPKPKSDSPTPHGESGTGGEGEKVSSREDQLVGLYDYAIPSVVSVEVYSNSSQEGTVSRRASGTGFVYDAEGHIITNEHVIRSGGEVFVTFIDGEEFSAEIVGTSPYNDLAVLKIDPGKYELKPVELGDSTKLKVGKMVVALGSPMGFEGSYTHGIVSGLDRKMPVRQQFSIPNLIQVDVPINQGNSGGPLLTLDGKVVGVNTAKIRGDNIGFAIPSDIVKKVVPVLIEEGEYSYPWIGIRTLDVNQEMAEEMGLQEATGVMVAQVIASSPADEAGFRGSTNNITVRGAMYAVGGDVIVGIDGREVQEIDDVLSYLAVNAEVGDTVKFTVLRDGERISIDLTLGKRS